jgi:hypothetical protein
MKYIDFDGAFARAGKSHLKFGPLVDSYRIWLEEHAGMEEQGWYWRRGDIIADGGYIVDDEVALLFKLKFEI